MRRAGFSLVDWPPATGRALERCLARMPPGACWWAERVVAKLIYHHRGHYRALIKRLAALLGHEELPPGLERQLRRLDSQGIGVWRLARCEAAVDLAARCRAVLRSGRSGPVRPVAGLLERSLAGHRVWWLPDLSAVTVLMAAIHSWCSCSLALTARTVAVAGRRPSLKLLAAKLVAAAHALQAALDGYGQRRDSAWRRSLQAAQLCFQSANMVRRAINRAALSMDQRQMERAAAELALRAGEESCDAAIALLARLERAATEPGADSASDSGPASRPQQALVSDLRSFGALAGRLAATLRGRGPDRSKAVAEAMEVEAQRVMGGVELTLQQADLPWAAGDGLPSGVAAADLGEAAAELARRAAEQIGVWSALAAAQSREPRGRAVRTECPQPAWAAALAQAASGRCSPQRIIEALRRLAEPDGSAPVSAAVSVAALPSAPARLQRELWRFIAASDTSPAERTLAFQLWWRLSQAV